MASTSVLWFRRDLRLADNLALCAAAARGPVVALFVHDPALVRPSGANRLAWLHANLDALDRSLDGALVERTGDPSVVVAEVAAEVGADTVFAAEDFGPHGRARDAAVADALTAAGSHLELVGSPYAVPPGSVRTVSGGSYRVFTPYWRAWREHGWPDPTPAPTAVRWQTLDGRQERPATPEPTTAGPLPEAGEAAALAVLARFVDHRVADYRAGRDRPDLDATSRLSPHLKIGTLHPRQALAALAEAAPGEGPDTWAKELAWREFYAEVLAVRPDTARHNFAAGLDGLAWDHGAGADAAFERWCLGQTGFPIVDAGMRQLLAEGWMHNRVRMIVASFLVKDLHVDWRRGARHFMAHLLDGDLASNQHGWQWTAGTGTDASPFFRVFNPITQGQRFDPNGDYVRRWVPELRGIAGKAVHEPLQLGAGSLFDGGAADYPPPMVDHAAERAEALERWKRR